MQHHPPSRNTFKACPKERTQSNVLGAWRSSIQVLCILFLFCYHTTPSRNTVKVCPKESARIEHRATTHSHPSRTTHSHPSSVDLRAPTLAQMSEQRGNSAPLDPSSMALLRQYLHVCTSKASTWSTLIAWPSRGLLLVWSRSCRSVAPVSAAAAVPAATTLPAAPCPLVCEALSC